MKPMLLSWMIAAGIFVSSPLAFSYDNSATSFLLAKVTKKKSSKKSKKHRDEESKDKEEAAKDLTAPDLEKNSEKKKKTARRSLGIVGSLGYEDLEWTVDEAKYAFGGIGFGGGVNYSLNLGDRISIPATVGLHMVSLAGENDIGTLTLSITNIALETGLDFWVASKFGVGGVVGMDFLMSGTLSSELKEEPAAGVEKKQSYKISSYNRMLYGFGLRYFATDMVKLFGDVLFTSGSFKYTVEDSTEEIPAIKYSGKVIRLGLGLYFM